MDYDSCRSLPAMFFDQAARLSDKPFLWAKHAGRYQAISCAAAARDVRRLALGLRSLGIGRGERVGLVGENRPEWVIADLAIMSAGAIEPDVTACLMHTSGTGGVPKGVMTSHRNILANCRGAYRLLAMVGLSDDVFLNFLPLSHTYEHTAGMMFPISLGAQIYFAEG